MRAVAFDRYGDADVLHLTERAVPVPGPEDVLLRVVAAGVNPADTHVRAGHLRRLVRLRLPFVPGVEALATVVGRGARVRDLAVGQRVVAMATPRRSGLYAEYAVLPARQCAPAPIGAGVAAAGLPVVGLTAMQGLRDAGRITAGQHVMVYGASGGVGSLATQLAVAAGCSVTAVASARNLGLLRELGAHRVLDYADATFAQHGSTYDVVFDAVGKLPDALVRRFVRTPGRFVTMDPGWLLRHPGRLLPWSRLRAAFVIARPRRSDLDRLVRLVDEGRIRVVVDRSYPLAGAAEAHRRSEGGHVAGKLLLLVEANAALHPE